MGPSILGTEPRSPNWVSDSMQMAWPPASVVSKRLGGSWGSMNLSWRVTWRFFQARALLAPSWRWSESWMSSVWGLLRALVLPAASWR